MKPTISGTEAQIRATLRKERYRLAAVPTCTREHRDAHHAWFRDTYLRFGKELLGTTDLLTYQGRTARAGMPLDALGHVVYRTLDDFIRDMRNRIGDYVLTKEASDYLRAFDHLVAPKE